MPDRKVAILGLAAYTSLAFLNGFYNPILYEYSVIAFWIVDILHYWGLTTLVLFLNYKHLHFSPRDYGLIKPGKLFPVWEIIGAGLFFSILLYCVDWFFWQIGHGFSGLLEFKFAFKLVVPDGFMKLPVILWLAITAGFVEEVLYRGLLWKLFSETNNKNWQRNYIFISAFLFSIIHWEQGTAGLLSSFAFGILAAMLFLKFRNLWSLILAHTLIDIYYFW